MGNASSNTARRRAAAVVAIAAMSLAAIVGLVPSAFALTAPTVTAALTPAGPIMYGAAVTSLDATIQGTEIDPTDPFSIALLDPSGTVDFGYCYSAVSTPVSCGSPTSITAGVAVAGGLDTTDGEGTAQAGPWTPSAPGYYLVVMAYSGDSVYDTATNTVALEVEGPTNSVAYGGQTYIVVAPAGTSTANLSGTLTTDATVCELGNTGSIAFEVLDINGNAVSGSPFSGSEAGANATATTGALPTGLYTVTAQYTSTDTNCPGDTDSAILAIVTSGGAVTGGGWYRLGSFGGYGSSRANFGLVLNKTYSGTGRNKTWTGFKGQFLWLSSEGWRIKTELTGDTEFIGTYGCPNGVGVSGSNPVCGRFEYSGVLQVWDPLAGPYGDWVYEDDVTFMVTFYDGGSVTICKKRNCTRTEVADGFGIDVYGWDTSDLPETVPVTLAPPGGKGSIKAALA